MDRKVKKKRKKNTTRTKSQLEQMVTKSGGPDWKHSVRIIQIKPQKRTLCWRTCQTSERNHYSASYFGAKSVRKTLMRDVIWWALDWCVLKDHTSFARFIHSGKNDEQNEKRLWFLPASFENQPLLRVWDLVGRCSCAVALSTAYEPGCFILISLWLQASPTMAPLTK